MKFFMLFSKLLLQSKMSEPRISRFLLLIGVLTFTNVIASDVTLRFTRGRAHGTIQTALLPEIKPIITFKCEKPSQKHFTGKVDLYSVGWRALRNCNTAKGKWLGLITCRGNHIKSFKTSKLLVKDIENYQILGIARKSNEPHKRFPSNQHCSSLKTHVSRLNLHFCDPVITSYGNGCVKEACPLSLRDHGNKVKITMSATSELDKNHTARDGWLTNIDVLRSLKTLNGFIDSSWCAAPSFDLRAQHLQVDLPRAYSMSAISTQGAVSEKSWVSSYLVHYHNGKAFNPLTDIKGQIKEFKGNTDQSSIVRHWLMPHMYGKIVRFYPTSYVGRLCMSVEIHGCSSKDLSMWHIPREQYEKEKPIRCNLPKQPGNCMASLRKWFFNNKTRQCEPFSYGGCNGNLNNFHTEDICRQECSVFEKCKKRCSAPFSSCVKNERGEEKCECIQECPKIIEHVCGSDGVTYVNECLFKKASCEKNTTMSIVGKGSCTACLSSLRLGDGQIRDQQISASSELDMHHAAKHGISLTGQVPQDSSWCSAPTHGIGTQYLQVDLLSVHILSGFSTRGAVIDKFWVSRYLVRYSLNGIDWILIKDYDGKDEIYKEFKGNTDPSSTVHHWLKPRLDARFVRFSPTSFTGQRCMRVELYGCKMSHLNTGSKSETEGLGCKTKCAAPFSFCVKHKGNEEKCECIQECPYFLKQVCGSDDVTYDNECLLKKTACEKNREITIKKNGTCTGCNKNCSAPFSRCVKDGGNREKCICNQECPKILKQVCGSDFVTYGNECLLKKTACVEEKELTVLKKGACAGASTVCENGPCPPFATCVESDNGNRCACPWCSHNRTRKICGSDWRTYKNFCELKRYACENNKHISVVSRGECEVSFFEANPEEKPAKQEKSSGFMKKIYISGIAVLILGVVIAIAMCASQPKIRRIQRNKSSFKKRHPKYQNEKPTTKENL